MAPVVLILRDELVSIVHEDPCPDWEWFVANLAENFGADLEDSEPPVDSRRSRRRA